MLIAGAKGFAREVLETITQCRLKTEICFYDDVSADAPEFFFDKFRILRSKTEARDYFKNIDDKFILGIGDPKYRQIFYEKFIALSGKPYTIISPFAKIGKYNNNIGEGCCILTDAIVESNNSIGKGCLIHTAALVSHDVTIGRFCEISPKANLLGGVTVGDFCRIGTASTILPNIKIGTNVVIGAGAVVTKNVDDGRTVVGIPAKPI